MCLCVSICFKHRVCSGNHVTSIFFWLVFQSQPWTMPLYTYIYLVNSGYIYIYLCNYISIYIYISIPCHLLLAVWSLSPVRPEAGQRRRVGGVRSGEVEEEVPRQGRRATFVATTCFFFFFRKRIWWFFGGNFYGFFWPWDVNFWCLESGFGGFFWHWNIEILMYQKQYPLETTKISNDLLSWAAGRSIDSLSFSLNNKMKVKEHGKNIIMAIPWALYWCYC